MAKLRETESSATSASKLSKKSRKDKTKQKDKVNGSVDANADENNGTMTETKEQGPTSTKDERKRLKEEMKEVDPEKFSKLDRRRQERKQRAANKRIHIGKLADYEERRIKDLWEREFDFMKGVLSCLPEVRRPHLQNIDDDLVEAYVLDAEEDEASETTRKEKCKEMISRSVTADNGKPGRAKSKEELRQRLRAKIAAAHQERNEAKHERKIKKLARIKEQELADPSKANKGKKFISQFGAYINNQDDNDSGSISSSQSGKTPIRKKPVKSDGQFVYSKFDFIAEDKSNTQDGTNTPTWKGKSKPKSKTEELIQSVEKKERKIRRLETQGKKDEAASLVDNQKWDAAMKRAQGQKVRDDPYLLKKTLKKEDKLKSASRKKWKERTEHVNKLKEERQSKRTANIQARKDDKKKRTLKLQRKRGRIA